MVKKLLPLALLAAPAVFASAETFDTYIHIVDEEARTAIITGNNHGELSTSKLYLPIQIAWGNSGFYDIIGFQPGALDNIKGAKEIVIPETYTQLGNVTATSQDVTKMPGNGAGMFAGCPDLEKITFSATSSVARQTGAGIITSLDGKDIYFIPPKIKLSSTELKMSQTGVRIGAGAFDSNASIAKIVFPNALEYVAPNAGFHTMAQIGEYVLDPTDTPYRIYNSALINQKEGILVSLPRCWMDATKYTVDMTKTPKIGDYAFANNMFVISYTLPAGITQIGDYAFAGSCISSAEILPYVNLDVKGKGAFMNCGRLTSLTFYKEKLEIPEDFARGSDILSKVVFKNGRPAGIGARAFKDCRTLSKFPIAADIQFRGDSIFSNTGFTEIDYEVCLWKSQDIVTKGLFAGCKDLKKIDMSKVSFFHFNDRMQFYEGYASDCPKLEEVAFPNFINLHAGSFTGDNALDKIQLADFTHEADDIFTYTGDKKYNPDIYLRVPHSHETCWSDMDDLLCFTKGAEGTANLYCGGFRNTFGTHDVFFHIDTYVPGFTKANYPQWCEPREMFTLHATGDADGMRIECHPLLNNVLMTEVNFDKLDNVAFDAEGVAETDVDMADVDCFTVYYTIDGVRMWTRYPAFVLNQTVAVDKIETEDGVCVKDRQLLLPGGGSFAIYAASGIRMAAGSSESYDLTSLSRGIYVATGVCGGKAFSVKFAR